MDNTTKQTTVGYLYDMKTDEEHEIKGLVNLEDGAYIVQDFKEIRGVAAVKFACSTGVTVYSLDTYSGRRERNPAINFTGKIVWRSKPDTDGPVGAAVKFGKVPAGTLVCAWTDD